MSLHCKPIVNACYLGLNWVEQEFEVAWVEQDEWVVVDMEAKALNQKFGWVEASTLVMGYSTKDVEKYMAEMVDWHVGEDIEVHNAKKEMWTMMDEWKSTKVVRVPFG